MNRQEYVPLDEMKLNTVYKKVRGEDGQLHWVDNTEEMRKLGKAYVERNAKGRKVQ